MLTLRTERLPNEPILIVHYEGSFEPDIIDQSGRVIAEAYDTSWKHAVFIHVTDKVQVNFTDIMKLVRNMSFENRHVKVEAELKIILVGSGPFLRLFANVAQQSQFGKTHFPLSLSVDNAVEVARTWLREKAGKV